MEKKKISLPIPAWLFVAVMAALLEGLVHTWVNDTIVWGRFLALMAFAFGFGGMLGLLVSLLPGKAQKWTAVAVTLVLVVFYLMQYFLQDAYQAFMPLTTVLAGAGGVATGFGDVVVQLLGRNVLRITLILAPVVLYAVFAEPVAVRWKLRGMIAWASLTCYLLGFFLVNYCTVDALRMTTAYSFDSAVRAFGVNMAMTLESFQGGQEDSLEFDVDPEPYIPETTAPDAEQELEPATEATEAPVIIYDDNVMDLDFAALAESEKNSQISSIHSYVASLEPSSQNQYTGLFEGKNLIVIMAEAFSAEVIDPELTPTLYRLANEGIQFKEFYQPTWGASTTSGEFSNMVGLVPTTGGACMTEARQQDLFLTIGKQLQKQGYSSAAFHANDYTFYNRNTTHTYLGYDIFMGFGNGMQDGVTNHWPQSDLEMVDFTLKDYLDKEPFSLYYVSVSGHSVYAKDLNAMSRKNFDAVDHLDCSETVKCYLASQLELEYALESMVRQLEEAGILENTVIVLSPDHYPYGLEKSSTWNNKKAYIEELYGFPVTNVMERDHNAAIIWSPCLEDMDLVVEAPTYSLDILPTISNLFGVEYDSRLLVGRDVLSDAEPVVLWFDSSWVTDKGSFDRSTGIFTPREGVTVEEGYVERIQKIVANKIKYCRAVSDYNYFNTLSKLLNAE